MNNFCSNCGYKLPQAAKFCPNCGFRIVDDSLANEAYSPVETEVVESNDLEGLIKRAKAGDPGAQYELGQYYAHGDSVTKDYAIAVKWYRKAAEKGYSKAQYAIGDCYLFGKGVIENNHEALKWFHKSAESGDADAQFRLGDRYEYGKLVLKDCVTAVKWYRKAAEQGHAKAQYSLGRCYRYGIGVPKDSLESIKWFGLSAEQGYDKAIEYLGPIDNEANLLILYRKAAEAGNSEAQYKLGLIYEEGKVVPKDYAEAVKRISLRPGING